MYGRPKATKTVPQVDGGSITIGFMKFLFKPWYDSWTGDMYWRQEARVTRYHNQWKDKELPRFVVIGSRSELKDYDSHEVYDTSTSKPYAGATWWDCNNLGDVIGYIKKRGNQYVFVPKSERPE